MPLSQESIQRIRGIADEVNGPPRSALGRVVSRLQDVANEAAAEHLGDPWRILVTKPPFAPSTSRGWGHARSEKPRYIFGLCLAPQISEQDTFVFFRVAVPEEGFPVVVDRWDDDGLVCEDQESLHAVVWEMMALPLTRESVEAYGKKLEQSRNR